MTTWTHRYLRCTRCGAQAEAEDTTKGGKVVQRDVWCPKCGKRQTLERVSVER